MRDRRRFRSGSLRSVVVISLAARFVWFALVTLLQRAEL